MRPGKESAAKVKRAPTSGLGNLRKLRRWVAGTLLAASLSGCTPLRQYVDNGFKVGPNYGRPEAPVAQDWIDGNDVRLRKDSPDLARWWTVLKDPVLDRLTDSAYRQNLTLREAGFRILAARADLGISVGELFPQMQAVNGAYTRIGLSGATANREFIPTRFYQQWDKSFGLAWELDFWGRYRRAIEASQAVLDASVENYDDVLVTLLGDVAANYVQIRTLQRQIELAKANVALQEQTLELAKLRFKVGRTSELDADQATSTLAQTKALIPQLEIPLRQAGNRLCVLLGIPPENLDAMLGKGPIPDAPADVAVGIPADLISRRPDVRRAEREAAAQCARIGVAVSELYPQITIAGDIGYQAEQFKDMFTPQAFKGVVGPGFRWNILNYGRLRNNIRLQDARFQELLVFYQNTVLRAGKEVEDGIVTFLQSKQQAKYLAESVAAAEKAVTVATAQYRAGTTDFNRLALIQQNLVQQQDLLAQAQGSISLGLIQVYRALGGGWQIRLAEEVGRLVPRPIPVEPKPMGANPMRDVPAFAPAPAPEPARTSLMPEASAPPRIAIDVVRPAE